MCNKNDAKEAVREVLTEKGEDDKTIVEHEVQSIVDGAVRKLTYRFGVAIVILSFGFGGWAMKLTLDTDQNTDARTTGDRYTQEEHDSYVRSEREYVDQRFTEVQNSIIQLRTDYKEDITEMKNDLRFIREQFTR